MRLAQKLNDYYNNRGRVASTIRHGMPKLLKSAGSRQIAPAHGQQGQRLHICPNAPQYSVLFDVK